MPDPTPGARMTLLPRELLARVGGAVKSILGGGASGQMPAPPPTSTQIVPQPQRREPWFGPKSALAPIAPPEDVAGRRLDYQYGYNINLRPREYYTGISFEQLRSLANYDLVRLAVETRKDQCSTLTGSVLPKMSLRDEVRAESDDRCQAVMDLLAYPDKRYDFPTWIRMLVDEQLTIDATSLYVRKTMGGQVFSIEQVAGETITPKIDVYGRVPLSGMAYQQILHGMPAIDYTAEELFYSPRNPTVNRFLGFSPVEQIILTVNTAIRRGVQQLAHFSEGNVPDSIISLPPDWKAPQVAEFQAMWDTLLSSPHNRDGRVRFVPGPMTFTPTRSDATLFGQFDEWLARVICYAFSLPSLPFVQQQNRATAETANERALEEGVGPMMIWLKGILDRIIQIAFGYKDLEWVWDDVESINTLEQARQDLAEMQLGLVSGDEIRAKRGLPPIGMTHMIWGIGPLGILSVSDLAKAQSQGLGMPQPPPPPGMMPGQPMPPGMTPPGAIPPPGSPPMLGAPRRTRTSRPVGCRRMPKPHFRVCPQSYSLPWGSARAESQRVRSMSAIRTNSSPIPRAVALPTTRS